MQRRLTAALAVLALAAPIAERRRGRSATPQPTPKKKIVTVTKPVTGPHGRTPGAGARSR